MKKMFSFLLALALVLSFSLVVAAPVAAATTWYVDDDNCPGPGTGTLGDPFCKILDAVLNATWGDTIMVATGTYNLSQINITFDLTIIGDPSAKPVIKSDVHCIGDNYGAAWLFVNAGVTFNLLNVVLDGSTYLVYQAIRNHGFTTVDNVDFRNIQGSASGSPYRGIAIQSYGGNVSGGLGSDSHGLGGPASHLVVTDCTFQQMGRTGVLVKGTQSTASVSGCTYTGKGTGDWLDYGVEVGAGGAANIAGNTITSCRGVVGNSSAGIRVSTYYGAGTTATITGNTLTGNTEGIAVGYNATDTSVVTAHFNNISGNTDGVDTMSSTVTTDATCNWWGDDSGPTHSSNPGGTGDTVSDNVDFDPWTGKQGSAATTTGAGNASFATSHGCIANIKAVTTPPAPPVDLPYGVFSFNISCMPGQTVTVTVTLPGPVPVGSVWWKYQDGSWYWLPIGSDDGDNTITVTLTDGVFPGDADKTKNGVITDPGGTGYSWSFLYRGLIISSTEGGRVTKPGQGHYVYKHGTIVKLVATPDDGYRFVEWTHDVHRIADVNAASTTITMDYSYVIIANFEAEETSQVETQVQYELTVSSTMGGSVTSPGEGTFAYSEGSIVNLVANPATGYEFVNWTGDGITSVDSTTITVTMNGDCFVQANFEFEQTPGTDDSGGESSVLAGCFIATAAYGTATAEQINLLREFRDVVLLESDAGSRFVALYYQLSPPVAEFIAGNELLRTLVRELLVDPFVWVVEATGEMWRN